MNEDILTAEIAPALPPSVVPAGIVVGVILVVGAVLWFLNRRPSLQPWSELQKRQVTLDKLTPSEVVRWIDSCKADMDENRRMFLLKATNEWVHKLGYECPKDLEPETNLIALLGDAEKGDISHLRLFSFAEADERIMGMFDGKDIVNLKP